MSDKNDRMMAFQQPKASNTMPFLRKLDPEISQLEDYFSK